MIHDGTLYEKWPSLAETQQRLSAAKRQDFLVNPLSTSSFRFSPEGGLRFNDDKGSRLGNNYPLTEHATKQLCEHLQLPVRYFERLRKEHPGLAESTIHRLATSYDKRIMVRTKGGRATAVVSDRYLRINDHDLVGRLRETLPENVEIPHVAVTETGFHLRVTFPGTTKRLPSMKHDSCLGVDIFNSEAGAGAAMVRPIVYTLICTNGLTVVGFGPSMKRVHSGVPFIADHYGPLHNPAGHDYEMQALETLVTQMRSVMISTKTDPAFADMVFGRIDRAANDVSPNINPVEYLNRGGLITPEESGDIAHTWWNKYPPSRWGLIGAITEEAQSRSVARRTELEELGGVILNWQESMWIHSQEEESAIQN